MTAESQTGYVSAGWWHPDVKGGQVHEHSDGPGRWSTVASHKRCQLVYVLRASEGRTCPECEQTFGEPRLGFATTRELLEEIAARIEVDGANGGGGLDYRTVDSL